jgi:hypothetical protein
VQLSFAILMQATDIYSQFNEHHQLIKTDHYAKYWEPVLLMPAIFPRSPLTPSSGVFYQIMEAQISVMC